MDGRTCIRRWSGRTRQRARKSGVLWVAFSRTPPSTSSGTSWRTRVSGRRKLVACGRCWFRRTRFGATRNDLALRANRCADLGRAHSQRASEGFLIALFAWALLRVLRRQNSGTRFAVWFLALLAVAALPVLGGFGEGRALMAAATSSGMSWATSSGMSWESLRPAITIPGRWALFVFLAWALGACAAMARLAGGLWRLRRLRRSCTAIVAADLDPAVRKTVDAIAASRAVA